jgi:hypothetical protein
MNSLPDPLLFSARTLERLGALVELEDGQAHAVLPSELAKRLSVPDSLSLGNGEPRAVACGMGSPLLERLVEEGRSFVPLSTATCALPPPRESTLRALAEAASLRNGVASAVTVGTERARYAVVALAWTVEADERYEGLVTGTVDTKDGGRPTVELRELTEDTPGPAGEGRVPLERDPVGVAEAVRWIARLEPVLVDVAVEVPLAVTARRHEREHERLCDYYRQLIVEAMQPRRKVDKEALQAKVAHLVSERDTRLADLGHRYAARVSVRPAALLLVTAEVGFAKLRARRRKGERELHQRLAPGARTFDRLPCDGCAGWISGAVALCDDQLHVLCERCVPEATGRPRCKACAS